MCSLAQAFRPGSGKFIPASFRSLSEKSRSDAMFIERNQARREEPIYGRKVFGFAPKGASRSQFGLVFYKHFAATRFPWQPHGRRLVEIIDLEFAGTNAWAR